MSLKDNKGANPGAPPTPSHSGSLSQPSAPPIVLSKDTSSVGAANPSKNSPANEFLAPTPQKQQPPRTAKLSNPFSVSKSHVSASKSDLETAVKSAVKSVQQGPTIRMSPEARAALQTLESLPKQALFPIFSPPRPSNIQQAPNSTLVPTSEIQSAPNSHIGAPEPEIPLHNTDTARLQHTVSHAVAAAIAAHPDPVSAPISFRNNPAQLTHWHTLFSDLSSRSRSLSAAEELQLHLVSELLAMHQDSVERSRTLDHTHMEQASALLASVRVGDSRSKPILIPSQSPAPANGNISDGQLPNRLPQPSINPRIARPGSSQQEAHTWLAPAQHASKVAAKIKLERDAEERRLYTQQQAWLAEEAQDLAILKETNKRLAQRRAALESLTLDPPASFPSSLLKPPTPLVQHPATSGAQDVARARPRTIRVRQSAAPTVSHTQEMRVAALTGDREMLLHGSDRIRKHEPRSDDDETEVLRELNTRVAAERLFFPTRAISFVDRNGYVKSDFVVDDADDAAVRSVSSGGSDNSPGDDHSHYTDGDPSSDYVPSNTPSSSPPARRTLSETQYQEYLALKRAQHDLGRGRDQPHTRDQPATMNYHISIADPPEHGDWRDIHHLTTTFKDKHVKYVHRCGEGRHLSVWECYTATAKQNIVKHLRATATPPAATFTEEFMASLDDDALYTLLQNELGIQYDMEVENALTAIRFEGSILDVSNWVIYNTAWTQVLKRVTPAGAVQPRRMAELFRQGIPDDFMRQWLTARKHATWSEAYDASIAALRDTNWQRCYAKHILQKADNRTPVTPKLSTPLPPAPAQTLQQRQQPPKPGGSASAASPAAASTPGKQPFDPFKFKTKKGGYNVNPNMKDPDYWENSGKVKCSRCDWIHRWNSEHCTNERNSAGKNIEPKLSPQEQLQRLKRRWDMGFFFSKPIDEYASPTVQESAQSSASTAQRLKHATDNKLGNI
jgi:hypothetical protein